MASQIFMLVKPTSLHQIQLMNWFESRSDLTEWAGPEFRFPFNAQTFSDDLYREGYNSYSLVNESGELVAFGQYYTRVDRCHLCRLVVSPDYRGKGVVGMLIRYLLQHGYNNHKLNEGSLFVYESNQKAIKAYEKLGFKVAQYPETMPMLDCYYMININSIDR